MTKLPIPRAVRLALLPAVCAALVGCGDGKSRDLAGRDKGTQGGADGKGEAYSADGAIALALDGDIAKRPGEILQIEIVDAAGRAQGRKAGGGEGKFEFKGLAYGTAKVKATVFGADGEVLFEGAGEAKIVKGAAATLSIALREAEKGGSLVIVIEKPKPQPLPKNSFLKISAIGTSRVTLRTSQSIGVCNGFETSVWGNGKETFVTVKSCEPFDVGPVPWKSEPMPLPADVVASNPVANTAAPSSMTQPAIAAPDSRCIGSAPGVDPAVLRGCGVLMDPRFVRYVRQYVIAGASVDKAIALLNSIEATVKPEVVPAIACSLPFGARMYSVALVDGEKAKLWNAYFPGGGGCWWTDPFRIETMLKANEGLSALARQEGKLVRSGIDYAHVPGTGGPAPLPVHHAAGASAGSAPVK